jgi:hypothetical protein
MAVGTSYVPPDRERDLRAKNINFKGEETATGADLVYVRSDPESVVLVQYKHPYGIAPVDPEANVE